MAGPGAAFTGRLRVGVRGGEGCCRSCHRASAISSASATQSSISATRSTDPRSSGAGVPEDGARLRDLPDEPLGDFGGLGDAAPVGPRAWNIGARGQESVAGRLLDVEPDRCFAHRSFAVAPAVGSGRGASSDSTANALSWTPSGVARCRASRSSRRRNPVATVKWTRHPGNNVEATRAHEGVVSSARCRQARGWPQGHRSPRLKVIASKGRTCTGSSSFAVANSTHSPSRSSNASRVRSAGSTSHRCATPSRA